MLAPFTSLSWMERLSITMMMMVVVVVVVVVVAMMMMMVVVVVVVDVAVIPRMMSSFPNGSLVSKNH